MKSRIGPIASIDRIAIQIITISIEMEKILPWKQEL